MGRAGARGVLLRLKYTGYSESAFPTNKPCNKFSLIITNLCLLWSSDMVQQQAEKASRRHFCKVRGFYCILGEGTYSPKIFFFSCPLKCLFFEGTTIS